MFVRSRVGRVLSTNVKSRIGSRGVEVVKKSVRQGKLLVRCEGVIGEAAHERKQVHHVHVIWHQAVEPAAVEAVRGVQPARYRRKPTERWRWKHRRSSRWNVVQLR